MNLKNFYIRRTLRIWPLYYLAVAIALVLSWTIPECRLSKHEVMYLVAFLGWLGVPFHLNPMGILWSISLEEVFYLIWPSILAWRGSFSVLLASSVIIPGSLLYVNNMDRDWYSPCLQFLYFAEGALMAVYLHRRSYQPSPATRFVFLSLWAIAWYAGGSHLLLNSTLPRPAAFHSAVVGIGCAALFLSIYRITLKDSWFTKQIIRLGKISYGLYVSLPL